MATAMIIFLAVLFAAAIIYGAKQVARIYYANSSYIR
jgi:hypothetical protein